MSAKVGMSIPTPKPNMDDKEHQKLVITGERNQPVGLPDVPQPPRIYPRLNLKLWIAMWCGFIGGPLMMMVGAYNCWNTSQKRPLKGDDFEPIVVGAGGLLIAVAIQLSFRWQQRMLDLYLADGYRQHEEMTKTKNA